MDVDGERSKNQGPGSDDIGICSFDNDRITLVYQPYCCMSMPEPKFVVLCERIS